MPDALDHALRSRHWLRLAVFAALVVAIVAAKLWLVDTQEIAGSATRHDALWFVRSAQVWYWGAQYDWTSFVRPPAYPLWLALVHSSGFRQRIAIELLQSAAYLAVVVALIRAGLPRALGLVAFALMCFHPASFHLNNYTMADSLYAAMLPAVVAGMMFMLLGGGVVAAVVTGIGSAVLWCTRAESGIIAVLYVAFFGIWAARDYAIFRSWRTVLQRIALSGGVALAVLGVLLFAVFEANGRTFRAFAKSEMESRSYAAAFSALVRIKPPRVHRFVPVTKESLEIAFAVSPAFARLKSELDGGIGTAWRIGSAADTGLPDEIRIDLLLWAIRNAAEARRIHENPKRADRFYSTVAQQINDACDEGKIECRRRGAHFIEPNLFREADQLPGSLRRILGLFFLRYDVAIPKDDDDLLPEEIALYDNITHRRALQALPARPVATEIQTWIRNHHWLVVALLAAGGAVSVTLIGARRRYAVLQDAMCAALLLIFAAVASRVALFTVIDATSWPVAFDRFLFPVMPLGSALLVAMIWKAASDRSRAAAPLSPDDQVATNESRRR